MRHSVCVEVKRQLVEVDAPPLGTKLGVLGLTEGTPSHGPISLFLLLLFLISDDSKFFHLCVLVNR